MSNTPHQWFYMKKTILSEDQAGPVSEAELKNLIFSGKMNPEAKLSSPTRTSGQWRVMKSIPTLLKLYESGIADRENQKGVEKQAKAAAKLSDNEIKRKSNLKPAPRGAKASAETNSKKPKKLVLIIGFGCILPAFLVFVVTAIFVYLAIRPTPPVPPVFSKSVDVDQATVMTVAYENELIYFTLDKAIMDDEFAIPAGNQMIDVILTRDDVRLEPAGELFEFDGKAVQLNCQSSDEDIASCSVVGGDTVFINPKKQGKFTLSVGCLNEKVECDFEFVQLPILLEGGPNGYLTSKELVEILGFPDSKKEVMVTKTYRPTDGFEHEDEGFYEHWRFNKYPKLIISLHQGRNMVSGIFTER